MAEQSGKRKRSETIECETMSPDGDMILAVGEPVERRIRVSSGILSHTSSVFKAMLSGRFREGRAPRSAEEPSELALPDDDPSSVADMYALLYHDTDTLRASRWTTRRLYHLAMTVDKYDCIKTLQLQCQALMLQHPEGEQDLTGERHSDRLGEIAEIAEIATAAFI